MFAVGKESLDDLRVLFGSTFGVEFGVQTGGESGQGGIGEDEAEDCDRKSFLQLRYHYLLHGPGALNIWVGQ